MPIYGEYETVGEPLSRRDERGEVATVWRARRAGAGEAVYAVKGYSPPTGRLASGATGDRLEDDRALLFLDGVKQLKKAGAEGGHCLAPVHAFGRNESEAWYVTDFYQRNSLRAWIDRRGRVDGPALAHVVSSVVSACLALLNARGFSHGNIKPANIFLEGQTSRPFVKTPLRLSDPYPASSFSFSGLGPGDHAEAQELLRQVVEAHDLRGIGELILQLVEGSLITRADAYNYPVEKSPAWERLGKDSQRWLALCNRLLDPRLNIEQLNLRTLQREFPLKSAKSKTTLLIAAGVGLLLMGGIGAYFVLPSKRQDPDQERVRETNQGETFVIAQVTNASPKNNGPLVDVMKSTLDEGEAAIAKGKWSQATSAFGRVTDSSQAGMGFLFASNMLSAQQAYDNKDQNAVLSIVSVALRLRPSDTNAIALQNKAKMGIEHAKADYTNEMKRAWSAVMTNDFQKAMQACDEAMKMRGKGPASTLKNLVQALQSGEAEITGGRFTSTTYFERAVALAAGLTNSFAEASNVHGFATKMVSALSEMRGADYLKVVQDCSTARNLLSSGAPEALLNKAARLELANLRRATNDWAAVTNRIEKFLGLGMNPELSKEFTNELPFANWMAQGERLGTNYAHAIQVYDKALEEKTNNPTVIGLRRNAAEEYIRSAQASIYQEMNKPALEKLISALQRPAEILTNDEHKKWEDFLKDLANGEKAESGKNFPEAREHYQKAAKLTEHPLATNALARLQPHIPPLDPLNQTSVPPATGAQVAQTNVSPEVKSEAPQTAKTTSTNIAGLDFVFVADLPLDGGKKGAYVSKHEVSVHQYTNMMTSISQPLTSAARQYFRAGDLPVWVTLNEATNFCGRLKAGADFTCTLPNEAQYLHLSGLNARELTSNQFSELKKREYIGGHKLPRSVTDGSEDERRLVDLIGNAYEWTQEGKLFGVSYQTIYYDTTKALIRPPTTGITNNSSGYIISLRPILVRKPTP